MYTLSRWNESIREAHAPRQRCGNAIVAVTRKQTADAAHRVAQGSCWCGGVHQCQQRHFVLAREVHEHQCAGEKSAEPRKPLAAEQHSERICCQFAWTLEH